MPAIRTRNDRSAGSTFVSYTFNDSLKPATQVQTRAQTRLQAQSQVRTRAQARSQPNAMIQISSHLPIKKCKNKQTLECHLCHKTYKYPWSLENHQNTAHSYDRAQSKPNHRSDAALSSKEHLCSFCGEDFDNRARLELHKAVVHAGFAIDAGHPFLSVFEGSDGGSSDSSSDLDSSSLASPLPKKPPRVTCTVPNCGKSFSRKTDLTRHHSTIHLALKVFTCSIASCSFTATQRSNMSTHELIHSIPLSERKETQCPFWGIEGCGFVTKSIYPNGPVRRHVRGVHSKGLIEVFFENV